MGHIRLPQQQQHKGISHVTQMDESCHTHGYVMAHIYLPGQQQHTGRVMSHSVTQIHESSHADLVQKSLTHIGLFPTRSLRIFV